MDVVTSTTLDPQQLLESIVQAGALLGALTTALAQLVILLLARRGVDLGSLAKRLVAIGAAVLIGSAAYGVQIWADFAAWDRGQFLGLLYAWVLAGGGSQLIYQLIKIWQGADERIDAPQGESRARG